MPGLIPEADLCWKRDWACCSSMQESVFRQPIAADSARTSLPPPKPTQKERIQYNMLNIGL